MVFAGLAFAVGEGEALFLKGPNGSGKSTLLRLMAGLLKPVAGQLAWGGAPVNKAPDDHRARLLYVGHQDAVKGALTVAENLSFWAGLSEYPKPVGPALDAFAIGHLADLPARFLSAGQKRRLNLARLKAGGQPLWLLDEPSNSLDTDSVALLNATIDHHLDGGGMAVIATHEKLADDASILNLNHFEAVSA